MATYLGHQEDSSGNILLPTPHSMATQIEFGTTASQAYAKGAYVVFNNRLCKASTAIASGDTLAIGTNLVQCSIGSELNSHLQAPNGNEFYFDYKDGKPGFYPSASKVASEFVPFGGSFVRRFYVGTYSSNSFAYGGVYIPISEIDNKTKIKVAIEGATNAKLYNNNVYLTGISSSFAAGTQNTYTGGAGSFVDIPSLSGYEYLNVTVAASSITNSTGRLFCTVELA